MKPLRFAFFGAGFWAPYQLAAWRELAGVECVAIFNRTRAKAEKLAAQFGIPAVYDDAEELLRREQLDFLDIATGNETHERFVLLAAGRRLPVICQKPMALEPGACERMIQACARADIPFLVHENFRWQDPMRRIRGLLAAGAIGRPFRAHLQFSHGQIEWFETQPFLFTLPHFALYDMGPHLLDLARFFFGDPAVLFAREFRMHPRLTGEDIVSVILGYDRLTCHCELTWRTTDHEVFIEGENGTIKWGTDGRLTLDGPAGVTVEPIAARAYPWIDPRWAHSQASIVAANAHLLAALRGEGRAETVAADNIKTMRLVFRAIESAASGRSVANPTAP